MINSFINYFKFTWLNRHRNIHCNFPVFFEKEAWLEGDNRVGRFCHIFGKVGRGTYICAHTRLEADIGRYCSIAWQCETLCGRHPLQHFVSTHPAFFSLEKQCGMSFVSANSFEEFAYAAPLSHKHVIIGNDVWVGAHAKIIGGVTIHDGAVILAGSVVTKDVPSYAIVGGVPAKVLKYRFDEQTVQLLLDSRWWEKDTLWLQEHVTEMQDIEQFKKLIWKSE